MKSFLYIIGIIALAIALSVFLLPKENSLLVNNNPSNLKAEEIVLNYKDYNYYPDVITLKANHPVRIYLNDSVKGCLRDLVIKDFGIKKHLETSKDYVEFTPTKKGTYSFACSMGMGNGKIIVE